MGIRLLILLAMLLINICPSVCSSGEEIDEMLKQHGFDIFTSTIVSLVCSTIQGVIYIAFLWIVLMEDYL